MVDLEIKHRYSNIDTPIYPLKVSSYFRPSPPSLRIGAEVGRGYFGAVHEGELDGQPVAVKRLHRHDTYGNKKFERECRLLEGLKHPNIVGFSGAFYDIIGKAPVLVMEMLKEKLKDFVNRERKLSLLRQLKLCVGLASGVEYLHSRSPPIAHCDLTDENVMLSEEGAVKIVDFGVAEVIPKEQGDIYEMQADSYYLPYYIALNTPFMAKIDVFSLGVWMLVISKGYCPTDSFNVYELPQRHAEDMSSLDDGHPLKPFILQCMKKDDEERPSAVAVHSFIESQVVSCNALLTCHPMH